MDERDFKKDVKKKILEKFPDAIVTQMDPTYIQGIPDMLILYKDMWATLEVKKSEKEAKLRPRPNQPYYIDKMNKMSFSSFIYPENEEEVLNALERSFKRHKRR